MSDDGGGRGRWGWLRRLFGGARPTTDAAGGAAGEADEPEPIATADATQLGVALAQAGRFSDAIEWFERAAAAAPGLMTWINLGSARHDLGRARYQQGDAGWKTDIEASRAALGEVIDHPALPEPLITLQAANLILLGEHNRARAFLLDRLPSIKTPAVRAEIVERLGSIALRPTPEDAVIERYQRDFEAGSAVIQPLGFPSGGPRPTLDAATRARVEEAVAALDRAVAAHPRSWPAWWFLGHGHTLLGALEAARAAFAQAWALHPAHPDVARELVLVHLRLGDAAGAAASDAIVALHPDDPGLLANHAMVLLMRGRPGAAKEVVTRARALDPGDAITVAVEARIDEVAAGRASAPTSID